MFARPYSDCSDSETFPVKEIKNTTDNRVVAIALLCISIVLVSIAVALTQGVAALPPETTMGFGMVYYIAGIFTGVVGVGVFVGSLAHFAVVSVRSCLEYDHLGSDEIG